LIKYVYFYVSCVELDICFNSECSMCILMDIMFDGTLNKSCKHIKFTKHISVSIKRLVFIICAEIKLNDPGAVC